MTIQINVNRTGFPVKVGSLELWFDSSIENLRNFFNIDEIAQEKLKEAQERAEHIHFPKGIENYDIDDFTKKDIEKIDAAFDVNKEFIAAQYDIIFGVGTFKEIYKEYPDIIALEDALDPLGEAIAKKIEEQEKERTSLIEEKKNEALKKQKEKQK